MKATIIISIIIAITVWALVMLWDKYERTMHLIGQLRGEVQMLRVELRERTVQISSDEAQAFRSTLSDVVYTSTVSERKYLMSRWIPFADAIIEKIEKGA